MTGVISAVIRFREWAALHGEMCVCAWGGGLADSLSFTGYPVSVRTVEMEN